MTTLMPTHRSDGSVADKNNYEAYYVINPDTGEKKRYARISSIAHYLEDTTHLGRWEQRSMLVGLHQDPTILPQAAGLDVKADKDLLNILCARAKEAGGTNVNANIGNELHEWTERLDRGEIGIGDVPERWQGHMAVYQRALDHFGLTVDPASVELAVVYSSLKIAGRLDRIVTDANGIAYIGDLKTGNNKSALAWSVQTAAYALADYTLIGTDAENMTLGPPKPAVSQDFAYVIWLPSGAEEPYCELIKIDLRKGIDNLMLAQEVREARNAANRKSDPLLEVVSTYKPVGAPAALNANPLTVGGSESGSPATSLPPTTQELRTQFQAFMDGGHLTILQGVWREFQTPKLLEPAEPTESERLRISLALAAVAERVATLATERPQSKLEELQQRVANLVAQGHSDELRNHWQAAGAPSIKLGDALSDDDLARIDGVVTSVEGQNGAPFQAPYIDRADPELLAQLETKAKTLPPDLLAAYDVVAKLPSKPTAADYERAVKALEAAEAEAGVRRALVASHLQDLSQTQIDGIAELVGVKDWQRIDEMRAEHVVTLCEDIEAGRIPADLSPATDLFSSRSEALKRGRSAAKSAGLPAPKSADDVMANPLLAALALREAA